MNLSVRVISTSIVLATLFQIFGCATILSNPNQQINVASDPDGAKVYIGGQYVGETPVMYKVDSRKTHNIEFRKEGYKTKTYYLGNFVGGGWVVLDVLFGLVPVIIDAATGSWYYASEDNIKVALEKE